MKRQKPMMLYYAAVGLAVLSNLFYHLCQKLTPAGANPALAITITYLVATGLSLALVWLVYPLETGLGPALRQINWASALLGVTIVGIELGYLLVYRASGDISLAQIVVSAAVSLLLIPVGLAVFKEKLTWVNGLGIVLCLTGLVLINVKA